MGLNPGRGKHNYRLVDMSESGKDFEYTRRSDADLLRDGPIVLSDCGDILHECSWVFRGLVVDFSMNHYVSESHPDNLEGVPSDVARIDCKHSEIHKHQFHRSGKPQVRSVIHDLKGCTCRDDAEELINRHYDDSYDEMCDEWSTHLQRWKGVE